jgi:hypothetical protein
MGKCRAEAVREAEAGVLERLERAAKEHAVKAHRHTEAGEHIPRREHKGGSSQQTGPRLPADENRLRIGAALTSPAMIWSCRSLTTGSASCWTAAGTMPKSRH